ncbi:hypothetical protein GBF38_018475 [Nibea albiflora]|uniref:Uncharacterized protein n=1 Tax=Nibea albiflora TaxID=240163 RepID=A0ACB7ENI9_NIBAL|nr:hypothetical protein GBF38_018475 [Nibea albiflora]
MSSDTERRHITHVDPFWKRVRPGSLHPSERRTGVMASESKKSFAAKQLAWVDTAANASRGRTGREAMGGREEGREGGRGAEGTEEEEEVGRSVFLCVSTRPQ